VIPAFAFKRRDWLDSVIVFLGFLAMDQVLFSWSRVKKIRTSSVGVSFIEGIHLVDAPL
jgi:hypothetical protein